MLHTLSYLFRMVSSRSVINSCTPVKPVGSVWLWKYILLLLLLLLCYSKIREVPKYNSCAGEILEGTVGDQVGYIYADPLLDLYVTHSGVSHSQVAWTGRGGALRNKVCMAAGARGLPQDLGSCQEDVNEPPLAAAKEGTPSIFLNRSYLTYLNLRERDTPWMLYKTAKCWLLLLFSRCINHFGKKLSCLLYLCVHHYRAECWDKWQF